MIDDRNRLIADQHALIKSFETQLESYQAMLTDLNADTLRGLRWHEVDRLRSIMASAGDSIAEAYRMHKEVRDKLNVIGENLANHIAQSIMTVGEELEVAIAESGGLQH